MGVVPTKLPNGRLLWPEAPTLELLGGNTADQIRVRRIKAAIIHSAYEHLEEKCFEGCSVAPELCFVRKVIHFLEEQA
jgi:hypothetical protein